jgi:hypothetical protein
LPFGEIPAGGLVGSQSACSFEQSHLDLRVKPRARKNQRVKMRMLRIEYCCNLPVCGLFDQVRAGKVIGLSTAAQPPRPSRFKSTSHCAVP